MHKHAISRTSGKLQPIPPPSRPLSTDLILDNTTAEGSKQIIVSLYYLTNRMEVATVPDTSRKHAIHFLCYNFIFRQGHCQGIIRDQGTASLHSPREIWLPRWNIRRSPTSLLRLNTRKPHAVRLGWEGEQHFGLDDRNIHQRQSQRLG